MNISKKKLGEVALVVTGSTPSKANEKYWDGDIPFVTPTELNGDCDILKSAVYVTKLGSNTARPVPINSILVCCIGSLGKVGIAGRELVINQQINALIFNENLVNFRYGFHFCKTLKSYLNHIAPSTTVAIVNKSRFSEIEMPVPALVEQKRIAAILDKADSLRHKRQRAIQLVENFLSSSFLEIFGDPVTNPKGWDEVILKDVADIRSGVTKGKKIDLATSVTLPYMRVANVQDGYLNLSDVQEITVSKTDAEKCKLIEGDILLTEGGDPDKLGRGYVWHAEIPNCIHQNHIFSVRVHNQKQINPLFLSALIGSQRGKRYFLKVGKQTTGIATINKTVLSEFVLLIPPYEVQMQYISILQNVKGVKDKQQWDSFALYESISQKAFSGQL